MKSTFELPDGCRIVYRIDDFTDRWKPADTLLFVHGLGESGEVWRQWVPYFARQFRVVRIDLRGFGESTPMPPDFGWSLDAVVDDLDRFLTHLDVASAHLVGGKSGGTMAMKFAAARPAGVKSVTGVCAPVIGPRGKSWLSEIEDRGVPHWARVTMPGRFGTTLSPEALEWWIALMAKTPKSTLQSYLRWVPSVDIRTDVRAIRCPAFIITTRGGPLHDVAEVRGWQETIPGSELHVIEGDCWHGGGAYPDACARATAAFIGRHCAA